MINKANKKTKKKKIKTIFIYIYNLVGEGERGGKKGVSSRKKAFHFFAQQTVTPKAPCVEILFGFGFGFGFGLYDALLLLLL